MSKVGVPLDGISSSSYFRYLRYSGVTRRQLNAKKLRWPEPMEMLSGTKLANNYQYKDIRMIDWSEAQIAFDIESIIRSKIESARTDFDFSIVVNYYQRHSSQLKDLDLGVAASCMTLSAARLVPATCCNGAAFGGEHFETGPVVVFYTRPEAVPLLLKCARLAGAGLRNGSDGECILYATDIRQMWAFAEQMLSNRSNFGKLNMPSSIGN